MSTATTTSMTRRPDALAAVAAGYRARRDIVRQTGRSERAVVAELQHQIDQGCISRTAFGRYAITERGRQVLLTRFIKVPGTGLVDGLDAATATIPELWEHRVARVVLRGSTLTEQTSQSAAEEYTLNLGPRGHLLQDVLREQPGIAALLERPAEQVIVEKDRGQESNGALLQLAGDDSPIYQVLEHPGTSAFDAETGQVTIGRYADGAPAFWELWNESGARNGVIAGSAGSGTTVLLRGLLEAVADTDLVTSYAVDIAGISGLAATGPHTAVTPDDARQMLHEVDMIVDKRLIELCKAGRRAWSPTSDTPLVLVVISDLHTLLSHHRPVDNYRDAALIERVQRLGRKAGVAVVAETKTLTWGSFGGNEELRAGLTLGNVVSLRQIGSSLGSVTMMDPRNIPGQWPSGMNTAGVGFTNARNAAFRAFYVPQTW